MQRVVHASGWGHLMFFRMRRLQKSMLADRRGATALEAAIVLPVFFGMTLATIEFGFLMYGLSLMHSAANIVARDIAVNAVDIGQAQADFERLQPSWFSGTSVTATRTNAGSSKLTAVNVQVSVPARQTTPIKILTGLYSWTLTANASVKQELPFNG